MRICFATNNQHKLEEVQQLLGADFELVTLREIGCLEDLAEDQETMEGNSLQKAGYVFQHYHIPCFADDSGLEVSALQGAPGVYSAHYAGPQRSHEDNMNRLLQELDRVTDRKAQFRCVITYVASGTIEQFEGVVKGTIITQRKGIQGFGYDPVFVPDGYDMTFAEMDVSEKNKFSHRAIAVRKFVEFLKR
jgi:XTP/dITP diphosphohydrolase